ncbi:hypothetical protein Tco_0397359 [Tanacetum coccineum]
MMETITTQVGINSGEYTCRILEITGCGAPYGPMAYGVYALKSYMLTTIHFGNVTLSMQVSASFPLWAFVSSFYDLSIAGCISLGRSMILVKERYFLGKKVAFPTVEREAFRGPLVSKHGARGNHSLLKKQVPKSAYQKKTTSTPMSNVFSAREEDNEKPMDELVDDKRKKVKGPPRKTSI